MRLIHFFLRNWLSSGVLGVFLVFFGLTFLFGYGRMSFSFLRNIYHEQQKVNLIAAHLENTHKITGMRPRFYMMKN